MVVNPKEMPRHYYSLDEYFALEQASDAHFEYWDGDIYCMSDGSRAHYQISSNVVVALANGLRGGPCTAFTDDAAIWTPTLPPYRHPGASVACGELQFKHVHDVDALINPMLIVEVLLPSTLARDEGEKFAAYQAIPTFREYLLIAQDEPRVILYTRQPDNRWLRQDVTALDASLTLASVGCALSVREIYEGVTFPHASSM